MTLSAAMPLLLPNQLDQGLALTTARAAPVLPVGQSLRLRLQNRHIPGNKRSSGFRNFRARYTPNSVRTSHH